MAGSPTVGVLALQGDYHAHVRAIQRAGGKAIEVRTRADLDASDGLVIPGGESTTMLKLIDYEDMYEPLRKFGLKKPIFGTCAGAILIAKEVSHPEQRSFDLMDIGIERNAYGRQIDSRIGQLESEEFGNLEAIFIRAPIIRRVGKGVHVIASYQGDPVFVEEGMHMAATFHPELTGDTSIHGRFLEKLK